MSKMLEKLVQKADKQGFARINGRVRDYGYVGKLEEKYAIEIDKEKSTVALRHWGTQTLKLDYKNDKILDIYGQGNSDRDSVNFILDEFDSDYHVHYYPSRYEFELHDKNNEVLKVI